MSNLLYLTAASCFRCTSNSYLKPHTIMQNQLTL